MWKWETEYSPKGTIVIVHDMMEHHEYYIDLIARLNRLHYHVVIGDLPGHGQTTRINKGHINNFNQYTERLNEWVRIGAKYELPIFVLGQGLGGLIAIESLKDEKIDVDGVILLNPLLAFKQSFMNRKNLLKSSVRLSSDESRFKLGFGMNSFTTDTKFLEKYKKDDLLVEEVSYHWYSTLTERMNLARDNMDSIQNISVLGIHSNDNDIIDTDTNVKILKRIDSDYMLSVRLNDVEHGIFQREEADEPFYYVKRFLEDMRYRIGFIEK